MRQRHTSNIDVAKRLLIIVLAFGLIFGCAAAVLASGFYLAVVVREAGHPILAFAVLGSTGGIIAGVIVGVIYVASELDKHG